MLGTPDYMAPEQWDDTRSVDVRADVYSLGCTLGYLLIGKAPFASDKPRSFLHIMKAHSDAPPPDLCELRPDVPAELNAIFQRLLAKKPEARFQSAAEVATALEPFCHQHDAPASGLPSRSPVAERSPVAPRQESRTSFDVVRANDSQVTADITRAPGSPVAERQDYVDAPTTSMITPRPTARRISRRVWFIVAGRPARVRRTHRLLQ